MRRRHARQRGSALIEFTLVGIPLIFTLISIFEIARGMWLYHTLDYAVTEGTRYASFHGINCTSAAGNSCAVTISGIASVVQYAGAGLMSNQLSLTFTSNSGVVVSCTLQDCLTGTQASTAWPPANDNLPGMNEAISATYPFSSAIAMFWPGAGPGIIFPTITLPANSRERIQF